MQEALISEFHENVYEYGSEHVSLYGVCVCFDTMVKGWVVPQLGFYLGTLIHPGSPRSLSAGATRCDVMR